MISLVEKVCNLEPLGLNFAQELFGKKTGAGGQYQKKRLHWQIVKWPRVKMCQIVVLVPCPSPTQPSTLSAFKASHFRIQFKACEMISERSKPTRKWEKCVVDFLEASSATPFVKPSARNRTDPDLRAYVIFDRASCDTTLLLMRQ